MYLQMNKRIVIKLVIFCLFFSSCAAQKSINKQYESEKIITTFLTAQLKWAKKYKNKDSIRLVDLENKALEKSIDKDQFRIDSITQRLLFSKEDIAYYKKQLEEAPVDFSRFDFKDHPFRYDSIFKKINYAKRRLRDHKQTLLITSPVFSRDGRFAIFYNIVGHCDIGCWALVISQKDDIGNWKSYRSFSVNF